MPRAASQSWRRHSALGAKAFTHDLAASIHRIRPAEAAAEEAAAEEAAAEEAAAEEAAVEGVRVHHPTAKVDGSPKAQPCDKNAETCGDARRDHSICSGIGWRPVVYRLVEWSIVICQTVRGSFVSLRVVTDRHLRCKQRVRV